MTKPNITNYLQQDSKALGSIITKVEQLQAWNSYLRNSLEEETLRDHCQIVSILDSTLIIVADSSAWLTRLRFFLPELLPRLRQYPSLAHIKTISCKVMPISYPKTKTPTRAILSLSPETSALLQNIASKIQHEALRKSLEKIASHCHRENIQKS